MRELVEEAGDVLPVEVAGWRAPGFATREALAGPRSVPDHRPVFLSPFDNLIWERKRVERLFDFYYRLEIYLPEVKRQFGYYVLPLLARGSLRGRADLKLDRQAKTLLVRALSLEGPTPEEAAEALRDLAAHLGADVVTVERVEPADAAEAVRRLVS